ncbi:chromosome 7 open reading frame 50 [Elysia marginata]|uniref:Chromosome 7 open reading frame 50 n=1 Tax=Elysia marginata TaxID=1093978 RepID=A0AAV4JP56_9GAST|nr:chromosome 7 open reading frame 50 [Elysia marginata]
MTKKRKVLSESGTIEAKNCERDEVVMEKDENKTLSSVALSTSSSSSNTDGKVKKKKRRKDKEPEDASPAPHAEGVASNEQAITQNQESDENVKRKKKKKKDKDKQLEHTDETNAEIKEIKDVSYSKASPPNSSSSAADQWSENTSMKKKKKKQKEKKAKYETESGEHVKEGNCISEAELDKTERNEEKRNGSGDIGTVDTDILKQASVNLGLPMADEGPNDDAQIQGTLEISKKKQKKKEKKNKDKQSTPVNQPENEATRTSPDDGALTYLRLWQSDRSAWKFNKRLQIRLIHNMYAREKLTDEDFEIFLLYLDGLQGKSREKTKEEAEKIVTDDTQVTDQFKQERARQVFQMLS